MAVWGGWAELGRYTGFGMVQPLPGLVDSFWINTAIVLPVSIEAYGSYALRVWLSSATLSERTRRYARWSALAAAHASCFSMALALRLGEHHTPPQRMQVEATVTLDDVDGLPTITSSTLRARAQVSGLDADGFATVVEEAAALCPVSRLFAGAKIVVDAELDQS